MTRTLALLLALLLAACGEQRREDGVLQTKSPGNVSAGGRTSGEVMAANTPGGAVQPGPAGTPGIPRGAEGNTGGTAMGGTTSSAQGEAAHQARALSASMDAVAARWRQRAAAEGWTTHPPTPTQDGAAVQASAVPTPTPPPLPIRSEKTGTAPASPDVKQPVKPPTDPGVGARAPDAAGQRP